MGCTASSEVNGVIYSTNDHPSDRGYYTAGPRNYHNPRNKYHSNYGDFFTSSQFSSSSDMLSSSLLLPASSQF